MDGCAFHSQSGHCIGCIFTEKGGYFEHKFECIYIWMGEVKSYNLAQMCSISGAIKNYTGVSVCLSVCPWAQISGYDTCLEFLFILDFIKARGQQFYEVPRDFYCLIWYKDPKNKVFLCSVLFRHLAVGFIIWVCFVQPGLFQINARVAYFIIISDHYWLF